MRFSNFRSLIVVAALVALFSASCARRRKYENPITKDTLQPDKVLFDKAMADVERSRFEVARPSGQLAQVLEHLLGRESAAVLAARAQEADRSGIGEPFHARLPHPEQLRHLRAPFWEGRERKI